MKYKVLIPCLSLIFLMGCQKVSKDNPIQEDVQVQGLMEVTEEAQAKSFKPFIVYLDKGSAANHYIPSGWMPGPGTDKDLKFDDASIENPYSGKTCMKIQYIDVSGNRWTGIYWQNPANNWGSKKGGFNLTGAKKLSFYARGENGGERIEEFKIGGITGEFPDTDSAGIGPVILTKDWQQYTIDLRGKDLSYISGGFCWATNIDVNPNGVTFYLDEIVYE